MKDSFTGRSQASQGLKHDDTRLPRGGSSATSFWEDQGRLEMQFRGGDAMIPS